MPMKMFVGLMVFAELFRIVLVLDDSRDKGFGLWIILPV